MPATAPGVDERIDVPITGMTCAACASTVERALGGSPGVHRAGVNIGTSRATVDVDPELTNIRALMDRVHEVGYGTAGTAQVEFVVDDSARPSGSATPIERHLTGARGVVGVSFNLGTMRIRVEYLPAATSVPALRREIEAFGYQVREIPAGAEGVNAGESEQRARDEEYRGLRRRFIVAATLSLPILIIAMSHGRIPLFDKTWINWLQFALATPVVLYGGGQTYRGTWLALRHRAADMNTLIAVGTGFAYLYSFAATIAPRAITDVAVGAREG